MPGTVDAVGAALFAILVVKLKEFGMAKRGRLPEAVVVSKRITRAIVVLRGHKVILDQDLALMYDVPTKVLVQAVKRNLSRFPADFMFQLQAPELEILRSQIVTSRSWGGRRTLPYAFTEQGVAMLSSVLRSGRAVRVNIEIMRAFVRLRQILESNEHFGEKLDALEGKYDAQFKTVFHAIRELMTPPVPPKRRIGFSERSQTRSIVVRSPACR